MPRSKKEPTTVVGKNKHVKRSSPAAKKDTGQKLRSEGKEEVGGILLEKERKVEEVGKQKERRSRKKAVIAKVRPKRKTMDERLLSLIDRILRWIFRKGGG